MSRTISRGMGIASLAIALVVMPAGAQSCPQGDLDLDGAVATSDLLMLLAGWGPCPAPPEPCLGDLDGDGSIGTADLLTLLSGWGPVDIPGGTFPALWINGGSCATEPEIQVHAYDADTYILRQSLCTNFEGPFIYLFFGAERVLMQDTGAGGIPIADTVYGIIDKWLARNGKKSIELIVSHSHGHGDHVAGDGQFAGQRNTTVVGLSASAVASFFGITNWPEQIVEYDLGGRIIDVIPIPGHQSAHIALYDRQRALLLTGDTLYPGRLYISNFPTYVESIQRLVDFVDTRPLC
ncbi:MAG: MBL fold metallo-hydrolase, partial [Planctomycetota bacterium]